MSYEANDRDWQDLQDARVEPPLYCCHRTVADFRLHTQAGDSYEVCERHLAIAIRRLWRWPAVERVEVVPL